MCELGYSENREQSGGYRLMIGLLLGRGFFSLLEFWL